MSLVNVFLKVLLMFSYKRCLEAVISTEACCYVSVSSFFSMSFSHYYICGFISLHVWTGWVVAAIWWEVQVNGTLRNIFS